MTLARCPRCGRERSAEELVCPHCGARNPVDLTREENWIADRDPLDLEPDSSGPFRFLLGAAVLFIAVAILLAFCASLAPSALVNPPRAPSHPLLVLGEGRSPPQVLEPGSYVLRVPLVCEGA